MKSMFDKKSEEDGVKILQNPISKKEERIQYQKKIRRNIFKLNSLL